MGYIRHSAIIVTTTYDHEYLEQARDIAKQVGLAVSEIVESPLNGTRSFLVAPDGSKEGWAESDAGDDARATLRGWLDSQAYEDGSTRFAWCEVAYGSDDRTADIVDHAWRRLEVEK